MEEHQKEYIKLLDEKFGVVGNPRRAFYSYGKIPDIGIIVELEPLKETRIFISDKPKHYYHRWTAELDSKHLPKCVWITGMSDRALGLDKGFFI